MTQTFTPQPSLQFYDAVSRKEMLYVYPSSSHWSAGWLHYKHPDGQWVTLRRATQDDIEKINTAVVVAHHSE